MKQESTSIWLERFQRDLSKKIMAPLESSSGHFRSQHHHDPGTAAYNQQYWFRIFSTLQSLYPLVCGLLGYWTFNILAQKFMLEHPSTHYDLGLIGKSLPEYLEELGDTGLKSMAIQLPPSLLVQAATIDRAYNRIFLAGEEKVWTFDSYQGTPDTLQLKAASHWEIISEDWNLLALRDGGGEKADSAPWLLPNPLELRRLTLLVRKGLRILEVPLTREQAKLYQRLCKQTLLDALQLVEKDATDQTHSEMQGAVQDWMALSMELGLWAA